jgi:hypothetical protein
MGSTMYLQHDSKQKFYYMSKQSKDDVLIFKNFDSERDVAARCELGEGLKMCLLLNRGLQLHHMHRFDIQIALRSFSRGRVLRLGL